MARIFGKEKGFTLIETIIGVAVIAIIGFSIYQGLFVILDIYSAARIKVAATTLANEELEIIRNFSYSSVGTVGGVPAGIIPQSQVKSRDGMSFTIITTVRNVDDPYDGTLGGSPNDTSPADYKLIELTLICTSCPASGSYSFSGRAAPKSLETSSSNGALFVQVIDSNGLPVSGATVQVTNSTLSPAINITDVTDVTGFLKIIDTQPASQSYAVQVSKSGYSSESTYAPTPQNPNPVKPHATVALGTVTQITFIIDKVSQLSVSSVSESCSQVSGTAFTMTGAKLIGTAPDVPKFSQSYTVDVNGNYTVSNVEGDNYAFSVVNPSYDQRGAIPFTPLNILSNSSASVKFVMAPKNPQALLVTVKDNATQLPLAGASITATAQSTGVQITLVTGRGTWRQTDWSGGSGQTLYANANQYESDDGNVDVTVTPGDVKLKQTGGIYAPAGSLISSIFDTGSASNFYNLVFQPQSQPPATGIDSLKLQIATATTTAPATWQYLGPDGTANTFYTPSSTVINAVHTNDRYVRYRAYFGTASSTVTPALSDVSVTFASQCVPPGQVLFTGLQNDTYNIVVNLAGYQQGTAQVVTNQPWQEVAIPLTP